MNVGYLYIALLVGAAIGFITFAILRINKP